MRSSDLRNSLTQWTAEPSAHEFPLANVIAEYLRVGKHFVDPDLLEALDRARDAGEGPLRRFLDTALDKFDGRFDNPSYLALHDLPLPNTRGGCPMNTAAAETQRDRLTALLVVDVLRFELDALNGRSDILPLLRPDRRTVAKRCAIGLRVLRTVLPRIGMDAETKHDDPLEAAEILCARVEADLTPEDRRMLEVTFLPVYTAHDEHLFVRMLQCYEVTFALVAAELQAAIVAVRAGLALRATRALEAASRAMGEVSPCFSLVATMQPEAFMAFREFTDGASAIQSRSYKTIESLCRRPDGERLAGPGYDAVPEVRELVLSGRPTLEDAVLSSSLSPDERQAIHAAMEAFQQEVLGWRRTHHNLALRMLGVRRGTGYTEGVPYLAESKQSPVFRCPFAHTSAKAAWGAAQLRARTGREAAEILHWGAIPKTRSH